MNAEETGEITRLATAVEGLARSTEAHRTCVDTFIARQEERCRNCEKRIDALDLDVNGANPPDELAPGVKEDVRSLKQSRASAKRDLRIAWGAIVALLGAPHVWGWLKNWLLTGK